MPKRKSQKKQDGDALKRAVADFGSAWQYAESSYHKTWSDAWKLYNNQRIDKGYQGISNTFVPITFSTIETMVSALAGSRPRFDFKSTKPEQEQNTKVLNAMLDYYWDCDRWQSKVDKWIRSMLLYGTGVLYAYWDIDKPRLLNVPLRDFFVDPTASNPDAARFMGRRFLTTVEELKTFEYVDEEGELQPVYSNLDDITDNSGKSAQELDKEKKDMFLGSTLGNKAGDKQVEVIEYWTTDEVIAVANRSVLIRREDNPFKQAAQLHEEENPRGILPFIVQRNYQDESLFYGKGEVEPIMGQQETLNDLTNQNLDAVTYQLNPMYTLDPAFADWMDKVESIPGAIYPFPSAALQPINMGNVPADAFNERINVKNEIRETTAADQVVKGVSQDTNATATEVLSQINQAGQRFAVKISQIENEGYADMARIVVRMVQLFVTEPMMIRIIGSKQGIDWAVYEPDLYTGDYEPMVQLESTMQAQKESQRRMTQEAYLSFIDNPYVDQAELTKMAMQKIFELDEDEVTVLFKNEEEMLPPEMPLEGGAMPPVESEVLPPEQPGASVADLIPQGEGVPLVY